MAPSYRPYRPSTISYSYINRYGEKVTGIATVSTSSDSEPTRF